MSWRNYFVRPWWTLLMIHSMQFTRLQDLKMRWVASAVSALIVQIVTLEQNLIKYINRNTGRTLNREETYLSVILFQSERRLIRTNWLFLEDRSVVGSTGTARRWNSIRIQFSLSFVETERLDEKKFSISLQTGPENSRKRPNVRRPQSQSGRQWPHLGVMWNVHIKTVLGRSTYALGLPS